MTEATWEQRMAARAASRRAASPSTAHAAAERQRQEAIERGKLRTRDLAEQHRLDYCTECSEVFLDGVHGWGVRLTCGLGSGGCIHEHAHHAEEVWYG